jgi:organic radical activating enzyme
MKVINVVWEDFCNYKRVSTFVIFPKCSFKCEKDCGKKCCQNSALANSPTVEVSAEYIVDRYMSHLLPSALVCGGMEPFDSWEDLCELVKEFRSRTDDVIVIYSGYYKNEVREKLDYLKQYKNIIVKFGRFKPDSKHIYCDLLGVELASDNQYARQIS